MTKESTDISISIVIPTYNEEEDIHKTLDACVALRPPAKEVIVVDDSYDNTPQIVESYSDRGVVLLHRDKNIGGRSGARNEGIRRATEEVVVILNADVLLPEDFISKIRRDYAMGADCVLVHSVVINEEKILARFLSSLGRYNQRDKRYLYENWSEGFSCRRNIAIEAGLFPVMPITITAGEDGYFGENLKRRGAKRMFDELITVRHYAPHRFRDFWRLQTERVSSQSSYFLEKKSILEIFIRSLARTSLTLLGFLSVIPMLVMGWRISNYSGRKIKDWIPFVWICYIQQTAFIFGKWKSFSVLVHYIFKKQ